MTQTKEKNPFLLAVPRFAPGQCVFCTCTVEVLKFNAFSICRRCIKFAENKLNKDQQAQATRTICSFCGIRYREILIANFLQVVKLKFAAGSRLGLSKEHCAICNECILQIQQYFGRREQARKKFRRELGPECGPEKCAQESCNRLRIRLAIRCLEHQFDQFEGL
ncbi:MAG: hypothetical protein C0507_06425 [Cyanobacteria bacterium PR.3.49]|nr:hypothetical protein [Cyanobacteria bacterium PR.3.49]